MSDLNLITVALLLNVCCRSEVKMKENDDFTATECQAVMKYVYLFLKENSAKKLYDMSVTLGDKLFYSQDFRHEKALGQMGS
jgi:hypothetical protein